MTNLGAVARMTSLLAKRKPMHEMTLKELEQGLKKEKDPKRRMAYECWVIRMQRGIRLRREADFKKK